MNHVHFACSAALLLAPATLSAHVHKVVMGTIESMTASKLVLLRKDGQRQTIPITKETKVLEGGKLVGIDRVQPGLRTSITLAEDDTTAELIKLPGAPGKK
ncbi:MAG: hypothetical protein IPL96_12730 [Holophagaceae bacterium]|nr:hypothetical protein [Holophagaceae bacterium]